MVKFLHAAAEIIHYLDQGETGFNNRLHYFHNLYCETHPTTEKFDNCLCRWAMKVWPSALDKIHEHTRNKYA